jgi:hypothetical protein
MPHNRRRQTTNMARPPSRWVLRIISGCKIMSETARSVTMLFSRARYARSAGSTDRVPSRSRHHIAVHVRFICALESV